MSTSTVDEQIERLNEDLQGLSAAAQQNEENRRKLQAVLMKATASLEDPVESVWKLIMSPHAPAALMVLIRMGVVMEIVKADKPQTARQLSESCGGDELLIVRMMRPLVALGVFQETDVQTYTSTKISEVLTTPPLIGGYQFMFTLATRSLATMPEYLEATGFKNVEGPPGPFQHSRNTADGMFPWLMKNPAMMTNFNAFMAGSLETRQDWFSTFPVDEIILKDVIRDDPEAVLLVDIGGGEGHDIQAFHDAFPTAPGKLVLQDLPLVIDNIKENKLSHAIMQQKHDFFQEQPQKGARAYYLRYIFHDWPDKDCLVILKQIVAAMKPGYSKLLIFEWVLPAKNAPLYPSLLDVNMMALLNGMERTEEQWKTLLSQAGLEVANFWSAGPGSEGLIEAVLRG